MRVQKRTLFLSIFLMIVGFAAVSTTLYLNGSIGIGTNQADFDVYFSKAIEDGVENNTLIQDKTHLAFRTELSKINEKYVLEYDVTNGSKQYDASIIINCTGGNDILRVENKFNVVEDLKARSTRSGRLTLTVIKSVFEETEVNISCEITGRAVERIEAGGESIETEPYDYLIKEESSSTTYLGHELDKSKVESITLKNTREVPVGVESWDVSNSGNGSVLAYTLDEDNNDMLELYIGQNGGVNANPNSTDLFYHFTNATSINGLEYLDTSNVTSMLDMFDNCKKISTLDVSHFNTSKVTNMASMFDGCSNLTSLDVSGFDTSNVTNMTSMFSNCSNLTALNLSGFDTSNVTSMVGIFCDCPKLSTSIRIRGIKCTSYTRMFSNAATSENAQITVNYTTDASDLVDQMIATKSSNSNVVKGTTLPNYTITISGNDTIQSDVTEAYETRQITLSSTEENKEVTSFKLNGTLINGNTFIMPAENVTITDVETSTMAIIESAHNPYGDNLNETYEKAFEGAISLTITLDYETESENYDWIYLYDSTGKQYGKYGGSRKTETIIIPGDSIRITFTSDHSGSDYYGFKATIIPNYE